MHDFSTEYRLTDGSTTFSQEEWINDIKAQAWEEGLEAKFKLLDGEDSISLTNPYRISVNNKTYDQIRKALDDK